IRINPSQSGFNLTLTSVINWTTPTITFTQTNPNAPSVVLTTNVAGTGPEAPASILLTAAVTDANNNVTKVEFFNGTDKLGEDLNAPYALQLDELPAGTYTFTAKATDAENLNGT